MNPNRIEWIDMAKGLGLILIMLGHNKLPLYLTKEICTFHVPMFFFLSGYVYSSKNQDFMSFAKKYFFSLVIPYFLFCLLNYTFWLLLFIFGKFGAEDKGIPIYKPLVGILFAVRDKDWSLIIGPLWFIPCLFFTILLFYIVLKLSKEKSRLIIFQLFFFSILGYLYANFVMVKLPWSIDASLTAVVFFGFGFLFKKHKLNLQHNLISMKMFIILLTINMCFGFLNNQVDMYMGWYGNYLLFYLSSLSGIGAVLVLVKLLRKSIVLSYIGANSFIFLALHLRIIFPIIHQAIKRIPLFYAHNNLSYLIYAVIQVISTTIILIPVVYIINKHFLFFVGKGLKNKEPFDYNTNSC